MINVYDAGKFGNIVTKAVSGALRRFGIDADSVEVEIGFIDAERMRATNAEARGADSVTDVLSFPALEVKLPFDAEDYPDDRDPETGAVMLGEIYICPERAFAQAAEYGHSLSREAAFLSVHGMLHLLGFDHIDEAEREEMEKLQDEILDSEGITRDYEDGLTAEDAFCDEEADNRECEDESEIAERSGVAVILGRPNAGKSTLINAIVGEKVAIVSWKPQTTRNRIIGVYNAPGLQIAFADTPGIHKPKNKLGDFMMRSVKNAMEGVDAAIYVVDSEKGFDEEDSSRITALVRGGNNTVVAVNKVDGTSKEKVAEILSKLNVIEGIKAVVPISALKWKNVDVLIEETAKFMPYGPKLYPDDQYTDKNMRFITSEIVREKALRLLDKEIPYGIAVSVNKYEYRDNGILDIDADVIVQKATHKPIVLGKGGAMIKRIAEYAREDLEKMTGSKIYLTLWVRVKEDWRDDTVLLNNLGYDPKKDS